jgi:hypothetical protein
MRHGRPRLGVDAASCRVLAAGRRIYTVTHAAGRRICITWVLRVVAVLPLTFAMPVTAVQPPPETEIPRIGSQEFEVHFQVAEGVDVQSAELWFTMDSGTTWHRVEMDPPPRSSPLPFVAPEEGLYGFLVIVNDRSGASAARPTSETMPQQWCLVDWTPPLVQLHVAQKDTAFARTRRVALRWTAYDAHLLSRPIDLYYRVQGQQGFLPIELGLPNSGRYDWRVPDRVSGPVVIKIAVSDRGGHVAERFSEPLEINAAAPLATSRSADVVQTKAMLRAIANRPLDATSPEADDEHIPTSMPSGAGDGPALPGNALASPARSNAEFHPWLSGSSTKASFGSVVNSAVVWADPNERPTDAPGGKGGALPSSGSVSRARELYEAATWYRLRGELPIARLRLQQALESDPRLIDARQDLAGVMFLQGDHAEAIRSYGEILAQSPNHRGALKGLALAAMAGRDYASAKRALTRLTTINATDGEAWLNLGDVCFLAGDHRTARDCWAKAVTPNSGDAAIAEQARKRLAAYASLSLPHE